MPLAEQAELVVRMKLDDKLTPGLTKTTGVMGRLRGIVSDPRLKDSILTGVGLGAGFAGFTLLSRGIGAVVDIGQDAIRQALEEEAGIQQLTRSIEENSVGWDGNIERIENVIRAREDLAFADEEQRESLRRLVSVTKDIDEALRLQGIAMDFARLRGIDLASAGDIIGKVYAGNVGILSRYGIQLERGTSSTAALVEIQKRATGQAKAFAETTAGQLARSQIKLGDAMENLGRLMFPVVDAFSDFVGNLADVVTGSPPATQRVATLTAAMKEQATAARDAADATLEYAERPFEAISIRALELSPLTKDLAAEFVGLAEAMHLTQEEADQLLVSTGAASGITSDTVTNLQALIAAQKTYQHELTGATIITGAWTGALGKAGDAAGGLGDAVGDSKVEVVKAIRGIDRTLAELPDSMKSTIRSGKSKVRQAMQDLRFAMEHPFAGDKYIGFLRRKQEQAMAAMEEALRQGKVDAYAQAHAIYLSITGELGKLDDQRYQVTVAMRTVMEERRRRDTARQMLDGRRASGGPVSAGGAYLVGERGPEILTMGSTRGFITPNASGGGRWPSINLTVRPVIPAYEVNREVGRIATTRRAGASVL